MTKQDPTEWSVNTEVKSITIVSLRDQFAMAALTGLLAATAHPTSFGFGKSDGGEFAEQAYVCADAMLEERENGRD